jgi:hypothetical protein
MMNVPTVGMARRHMLVGLRILGCKPIPDAELGKAAQPPVHEGLL